MVLIAVVSYSSYYPLTTPPPPPPPPPPPLIASYYLLIVGYYPLIVRNDPLPSGHRQSSSSLCGHAYYYRESLDSLDLRNGAWLCTSKIPTG